MGMMHAIAEHVQDSMCAATGALVAAMMDMRLKRAMPAIILGVIIAGVIVTTVTYGAGALFS